MNYHIKAYGDANCVLNLMEKIQEEGKSAFKVKSDFLITIFKEDVNNLLIEISSFNEITEEILLGLKSFSSSLNFQVKCMSRNKHKAEGYEISKGNLVKSFKYEGRKDICKIIEKYIKSLHIMYGDSGSISYGKSMISNLVSIRTFRKDKIMNKVEERIFYFLNDEKISFNIEYIEEKDEDFFSISDIKWKTDRSEKNLSEALKGNPAENFFHVVGFKFAIEISNI